jgi:autotransporter-associated beta strand protein
MNPRLRGFAFAAVACLLGALPLQAQTFTWTGYNGTSSNSGFWQDNTQWLGNTVPTFTADSTVSFGGSVTQQSSGYYTTVDSSYTINSLVFNIEGSAFSSASTNGIVVLMASSLGNGLTMQASSLSVAPSIVQNGYGTVLLAQNGTFGSLILGSSSPLNVGGTGTGLVRITAPITGGGSGSGINVNFSPTALRPFFGGASLLLSGVNTFTGNITLTNGNLALSNNGATVAGTPITPLGAATNQLIINPGINSLRFVANGGNNISTAQNLILNPVVLNSTMNYIANDSAPGAFGGVISGTGGITLQAYFSYFPGIQFSPILSLQNANTFTGPLIVRPFIGGAGTGANQNVAISSTTASGGLNGSIATTDLRLYPGSGLHLDNTVANLAGRLNPATILQSYRGLFGLTANASAPASDAVASLVSTGQTILVMTPTTTSGATFTIGSLTRSQNATYEFRATGLGGTVGANNVGNIVITNNPGGQTVGSSVPGTQNLAVLPYAYTSSTSAASTTSPIIDLVRWDPATGRIIPLNRATEYAGAATLLSPTTANLNYRISGVSAGGAVISGPSTTVNGLILDSDNATLPMVGVSLGGTGTLNINGPLVFAFAGSPSWESRFLPNQVAVGSLNFGSNTGYIHAADRTLSGIVTISSPVSGSAGIVKGGNDTLNLVNANSFTGGLFVNAGIVTYSNDANLGAAGEPIILNTGSSDGIQYAYQPYYAAPIATSLAISRPLILGPAGGTLSNANNNSRLDYAGPISGLGNLFIGGGGVVAVGNPANSFAGDVAVLGNLVAGNDAALGAATNRVILQGIFSPAPGYGSTNRDFLVNSLLGSGTFHTNGNDFTINGVVGSLQYTVTNAGASGTSSNFTKIGAGTLTLTANNSLEGAVTIGESPTAAVRTISPNGTAIGGTLRLAGPNGALPSALTYSVNSGAAFTLDNTAAANSNRISLGLFTLNGTLNLLGNASASVNEQMGAIAPQGGAATITLVQPDSGGAGRITSLNSTFMSTYFVQFGVVNYTPAFPVGGTLFVRGTNLGASTGDRTAFYLATDPAKANGIIVGAVAAASATSGPTDFATTVGVGSQFSIVPLPAASYGTLAAAGPTVNADQSGTVATLGTPASLNALRIGAGGGVNLGTQILTLGTGTANEQAGMILSTGANSGFVNGTLAFGSQPARVITSADLTLGTAAQPVTITGTGGLIKSGTGRLTLFGTPTTTLSGATVNEGTLFLGNANAFATGTQSGVTGVSTGFLSVGPGATLDINSQTLVVSQVSSAGTLALGDGTLHIGSNSSISGALTGSASSRLVLGFPQASAAGNTFGSGQQTQLYGDNSGFKGSFTILSGILRVFSTSALGTGTSPIILGDTSGNTAADLRFGDTYPVLTRDVIVQGGGTGLASINLFNNAVLTMAGSITLNKNTIFSGGGGTGNQIITGQISGPGQLLLAPSLNVGNSGPGNYLIANAANTYTGGTLINAGFSTSGSTSSFMGVIGVGADTAFSSGPLTVGSFGGLIKAEFGARTIANPILLRQTNTLPTGATLAPITWGSTGLNDIAFTGSITPVSSTGAIGMTLTLNSVSQGLTTFSGATANGGLPSLGITKNGPGQVVLGGTNTHSGITTVSAGTLRIANPNALGNLGRTATLNNNGGTVVSPGAVLDLGGQQGVVEVITLAGGALTNSSATRAVVSGGAVSSLTLTAAGGTVTSAPTVTITGGGGTGATAVASLALTNASLSITSGGSGFQQLTTFPAPVVTITGGGGTGAQAVPVYGLTSASFSINNPGSGWLTPPTVTLGAPPAGGTQATAVATVDGNGLVTGVVITNPGSGYTSVPSITFQAAGAGQTRAFGSTVNGQFTVVGLQLTNPGTGYTGPATVTIAPNTSYGVAASGLTNTTNFGVGIQLTNNGTGYTSAPTVSIVGSSATATANLAGITLTASSLFGGNGDLQIDSPIGGATFGMTKIGTGTAFLNGANTFTGGIAVTQGRLSIATVANGGTASPLGQSTSAPANLAFNDGTAFEFTGTTASTDRGMTFTGGSTAVTVTSAATTLTVSGVLAGSGGITLTGAGTLALSGANTFTGPVAIVSGTLGVGTFNNSAVAGPLGQAGDAPANLVLNGGTLNFTGATASSTRGFTLGTAGGTIAVASAAANLTIGGNVVGAGGLTKAGFGTLTLTGTSGYAGSTTIAGGRLAVASEAALGAGPVNAGPFGTLAVTASTTLAKTYALTGGTVAAGSGATVTLGGATLSGGNLAGPGSFATTGAAPAALANMTILPSATLNLNASAGTFLNTTNGGAVNVAAGLATPVLLDGFYNQPGGTITLGVNSNLDVGNFQSIGSLILLPSANIADFTQFRNVGTVPLQFGGGSRTIIGSPATAGVGSAGIDLNGKNAVVSGGLLVNNGLVFDSSPAGTATLVADYGARIKGAGIYQNAPLTVNGGVFQAGNSPGAASVGRMTVGPGFTNTFAFQINNATGVAGPSPDANNQVSGWSQFRVIRRTPTTSFPGDLTWTADAGNKAVIQMQTLANPTTVGDDTNGLMANFDPNQRYRWAFITYANTYTGPTDSATLTQATTFDTTNFVNATNGGTFSLELDTTEKSIFIVFNPVPEPGLVLGLAALVGGVAAYRRRKASAGLPRSEGRDGTV